MVPELGHFAIILSLGFALLAGTQRPRLVTVATFAQSLFISVAMICLILCFLSNDMTVAFVSQHSHQTLPLVYRVGAAWGGHEGSLLLWCVILGGWSALFAAVNAKSLAPATYFGVLRVLAWVNVGFISFLLFTSNPFLRIFPTELLVGDDLTPVLQDPGLIFHPPILYLGYVGFALPFAFAITALWQEQLTLAWIRAVRPWVILPWSFLSCGIVLGSLWAYRELGWGGWWFWDPVENASLLPWLSATALIHTLVVAEKRETFKGWSLLLALVTFALSLLGTFLVRSGVLVSVHAFASDPTRGLFLLAYLALLIGGSLTLYTVKISNFYRAPNFKLLSRETLLLLNSIFLLTAVATICLGTLYPIILEALDLGKISVGEPYFTIVFLPLMLPMLLLMGLAPYVRWQQQSFSQLVNQVTGPFVLSVVLAMIFLWNWQHSLSILAVVGVSFAIWIIFSSLRQSFIRAPQWSMIIAHLGIAIMAIGITVTKTYSVERQVKMRPGDTINVAQNTFTFDHLAESTGPNYKSLLAYFNVNHHSVVAEQKIYVSHEQNFSKPGILVSPVQDLYIALGSPLAQDAWTVRIYVKPLVRWIWTGGFLLVVGGLLSLLARRKRERQA